MRYGIPYQGSKNKIANDVIQHLPEGDVFIDLFAGGCAITHAALLSEKYKKIIANDITEAPKMFYEAIRGKFNNEKRWISREEFQKTKNDDLYVSLCWSFGNNQTSYLYSKEIEPWKKALHFARVFNDFSEFEKMGIKLTDASATTIREHEKELKNQYAAWYLNENGYKTKDIFAEIKSLEKSICVEKERLQKYLKDALNKSGLTQAEVDRYLGTSMSRHYFGKSQWNFPTKNEYIKLQALLPLYLSYDEIYGTSNYLSNLKRLQSLESLQRLQNLQSLQNLENPQSLEITLKDYRSVNIPKNAIVYADPPYKNTCTVGYKCDFDYEEFEKWVNSVPFMVIISEYSAPRGCIEVSAQKICQTFSMKAKDRCRVEKLFVQKRFYKEYQRLIDF